MNPKTMKDEVWICNLHKNDGDAIDAMKRSWKTLRFDSGYERGASKPNDNLLGCFVKIWDAENKLGENGVDRAVNREAAFHAAATK